MTLELQINEATKAFLPEGALEFATPIKRVELKSPDGCESKVIIGQLIPDDLYPHRFYKGQVVHDYSLLVFRPEISDIDANFIAYRSPTSSRSIPLTFDEACALPWNEEFQSVFSDHHYRLWVPDCAQNSFYVTLSASNYGRIQRMKNRRPINMKDLVTFMYPSKIANLYGMPNSELDQYISNLYQDKNSEFRFAVDWMNLSIRKKNQIAFACDNGNWDELREVAKWLFQVFLGRANDLADVEYSWSFSNNAPVASCDGSPVMPPNSFLRNGRAAFVEHYQPKHLDSRGFRKDCFYCVRSHIEESEYSRITSYVPTQHETIELVQRLYEWRETNFPAEEDDEV